MPKTSRSDQMDFKGLEIIADEFTGTVSGTNIAAASAGTRGTVLKAATVAAVASANAGGTYTAAEQTLINELKTQLNALIANLKTAGVVA